MTEAPPRPSASLAVAPPASLPAPLASAPVPTPRQPRPAFYWLATVALLVTIFARAQGLLVPLALAIVVSFALSPTVKRLERALGRHGSVVLVVLVSLGVVTGFGYLLKRQVVDLSAQMTKYSDSIRRKVVSLRGGEGTGLAALSKSVERVVADLDEHVAADAGARPVRVIPAESSAMERIENTLAPVLGPLAESFIVLVLVIMLLIKREDIRDRFIRLVGRGHVTLTTRTLDEAGHRISRFLALQSAINFGFGTVVALGLFAIGIPYAPLWGFMAAMLRFVPILGVPLATVIPAALAFAQFAGWWQMLATLGVFLGLDIVTAYVVEPVVIGARTGVSSMAMLMSAIFWSWLWGPVGLLLSTPLTVCLAVLGKHVPRLSYLAVLLGDEPALEDSMIVYQRLLSGDEDEAEEILDRRFRAMPRGQVFDEVVIPALLLADRDRARNEISEADHQFVLRVIRTLVDTGPDGAGAVRAAATPADAVPRAIPRRVLGVSARTATDETIWEMWSQLFDATKVNVASIGSAYLSPSSEETPFPGDELPDLVSVISIPPGGLAQARYICRRLRAKLPQTPIVVIRPGVQANAKESAQRLTEDGASRVSFTLEDAHTAAEQQLLSRSGAQRIAPAL